LISSSVLKTDPPSLAGETNGSDRRGDGSFDKYLEEAQNGLPIFPWSNLFSLFDLKLDMNFQQESPEDKKVDFVQKEKDKNKNQNTEKTMDQLAKIEPANKSKENLDYINFKLAKDILLKNLPQPSMYLGLIPNQISNPSTTTPSKTSIQTLIDEIAQKIEFLKKGNESQVRLTLSEENLGDMLLSLSLKNGMVSIQIAASTETKKYFDNNISELEISLKEAKIDVESLKIVEVKNDTDIASSK